MIEGKARILGDNISGDHIISKEYIRSGISIPEMIPYLFHVCRPDLGPTLERGDIIVAGENFGCGSSREHVILALREAGIRAIVAKSFARTFYRACINEGILPAACAIDTHEHDLLRIDPSEGTIQVNGKDIYTFHCYPELITRIMEEGGLMRFYQKYGL